MRPLVARHAAAAFALLAVAAGRTAAQETPVGLPPILPPWVAHGLEPLVTPGSAAADRLRVEQLLGRADEAGSLLRSAASLTPPPDGGGLRLALLQPSLTTTWNSGLPFSMNDGAMWAGRGWSYGARFGAQLVAGPVRVILAPELYYQQNLEFQTIVSQRTELDRLSSPWHSGPESIDLPSRFGLRSFGTATWGQSSAEVGFGPLAAGASSENLWWGPGIRTAIVMSDNAAGIPQLFLRTRRPVHSVLGEIEGRWLVGRLGESAYFDTVHYDDRRSLAGLAVVLRPAFDRDLSLGFTRVVYAPRRDRAFPLAGAFDVLRSVGRPDQRPLTDRSREPAPDQVASLLGRWLFPASGFEVYGEWARYEEPASLRDFLETPNHSQGYTLGVQWAHPLADSAALRLQAEASDLEPSTTYADRRVVAWYTSRTVPQGYTQRGQVIGAAIGPGASGQWLAADYLRSDWRVGAFVERIRWDNAAFFEVEPQPSFISNDFTVRGGLRGGATLGAFDVDARLSVGTRFNYLFQNPSPGFESPLAVDLRNYTLQLTLGPRARARPGR